MKALYPGAWLVIILFLGWSGNLLVNIQTLWSDASDLHKLSGNFDDLVDSWKNMKSPNSARHSTFIWRISKWPAMPFRKEFAVTRY
jgi:hypothetical protein